MAIATEALPVDMGGPNIAGINTLSSNATTTFTRYYRRVLPLDGYVFWVAAETASFMGSVHVIVDKHQNEDETIAINRVLFTTKSEIQSFNRIGPNEIWIGETAGVRFAFSTTGSRYKKADLWHYQGDAIYPALESQIIGPNQTLTDRLIVSNSLPAWLQLVEYDPIWLQIPNPRIMLFPSFAVPDNIRPPYGVVHIAPEQTKPLQAFPRIGRHSTQWQLVSDQVRVTLYGATDDTAMDFVNLVNQFSEDTNSIGMMDIAAVRDEKRTQAELSILAMKKTIEYQVSYNQGVIRDIARALIEKATATIIPQGAV